ncbi:dynamin family protein [Corynebacterium frankenforstense]
MDPIRDALRGAQEALARMGGEFAAEVEAIDAIIGDAPRIVIAGRLKAGKSTLVNALIGAPVAETAALEATNVVTVYRYGAPDRAEAVLDDGSRMPVRTRRGERTELPCPATRIAYINRWMPVAALRDLTLIDTPGMATLTVANERATRNFVVGGSAQTEIDGFAQTKGASAGADAVVFLFDSVPRADEIGFLTEIGFTPLNTLGVLSRADSFGRGALGDEDPLEHAAAHSQTMVGQLGRYLTTVLPIAGLLAQTAYSGAVTESRARALGQLAPASVLELLDAVETTPEIAQLVDLFGEYGLFHGREVAAQGAAQLQEWLVEKSNVPRLMAELTEALGPYARRHRALRSLEHFDQMVYRHPGHRDELREIASRLRRDPRMLPVVLLGDLKALLAENASEELIAAALEYCAGLSNGQRLGLTRFANGFQIVEAVRVKREWLDRFAFRMLSPAEEATVNDLRRAYTELDKAGQALL